jgi:hypothetical protein
MLEQKIISLCFWILFASHHGIYDAVMFSRINWNVKYKKNPHTYSTWMSFVVASGFLYYTYFPVIYFSNFYEFLLQGIMFLKDLLAYSLIFSFWHNGFYFEKRKRIDSPSGYWFFGQSRTSTSKLYFNRWQLFEFNAIERTVLFVLGINLLFFKEIYG